MNFPITELNLDRRYHTEDIEIKYSFLRIWRLVCQYLIQLCRLF